MLFTILDCYTDEPAGLGVPPYLGTYPRYIAGKLLKEKQEVYYITIDDLRLHKLFRGRLPETRMKDKTNIKVHNFSQNANNVTKILDKTDTLISVIGAHTPGKYLAALPATVKEAVVLTADFTGRKLISGPAASEFGTSFEGGRYLSAESVSEIKSYFDDVFKLDIPYAELGDIAVRGASICSQVFTPFVGEIETSRGCVKKTPCSFCTDPLKFCFESREQKDIYAEAKELIKYTPYFRLGKQSCFYSYKLDKVKNNVEELKKLLKPIAELKPKVLHIDNANPAMVDEEKTKLIVEYCTAGNIAPFGVETFDEDVIKKNNLNTNPELTLKAIKIINKYGRERGDNGMYKLLPGLNLLFGLIGETKNTWNMNCEWLKKILDMDLLIRRINIRQVVPYIGTQLFREAGVKYIKKNRSFYWHFRNKIRQDIDLPMMRKVVPIGTVLKEVRAEVYDGNTTFCRQLGTYPLIVGVKGRLELNKFYSIKITGHMLRSVTGEVV